MEESIISVMIDYGTLGITCGVLFWLHLQNTKRNDQLIVRFQATIEDLRKAAKEDEDKIRDRFMSVIEKYDTEREAMTAERTQLRSNLASKISDQTRSIEKLETKIDSMMVSIEQQSTSLKEIRLAEMARSAARNE